MKFKEAMKTPKQGWGRTENEEKLLAVLCDCLARRAACVPSRCSSGRSGTAATANCSRHPSG